MGQAQINDLENEKKHREFMNDSGTKAINAMIRNIVERSKVQCKFDLKTLKFTFDMDETSKSFVEYWQNEFEKHKEQFFK